MCTECFLLDDELCCLMLMILVNSHSNPLRYLLLPPVTVKENKPLRTQTWVCVSQAFFQPLSCCVYIVPPGLARCRVFEQVFRNGCWVNEWMSQGVTAVRPPFLRRCLPCDLSPSWCVSLEEPQLQKGRVCEQVAPLQLRTLTLLGAFS